MRRLLVAAWVCAVLGPGAAQARQETPAPAPPAPAKEVQPAESRLQFYGFIRTDVILDDSRPDSAQSPLFILSEGPDATNRANFTMHPRLTRFGINFSGPALEPLGGARISGKLEIDFQNGGRESRAIPRYRHAYLTLSWATSSLLIGQTFDIISPLFPSVNADTLMWNAGNVGDRRPQIRATIQPPSERLQWSATAGIGLTGAVDQQDLDADGIRDGEASALPNVQGRLGITYPLGTRRLGVGAWAHGAWEEVTAPIAGETRFDSHTAGVDLEVPLGRRAMFRGEVWTGSNLSDVRGGIGQGINRTTGEGIDSQGGWGEISTDVTPRYSIFAGYTIEAPDAEQVPASGRTRNSAWYLGNRFSAGRPFVVGIDYLRWETEYRGLPSGTDNRVNLYFTYNF
jgi:hypothetical protein